MKLIFGFSGNPPHFGHVDVIQQALGQLPLVPLEVIIVPVRSHPFGKALNDFMLIMEMAEAFAKDVNDICNVACKVMDVEGVIIKQTGKETVYSVDVLKQFQQTHPDEAIVLCFGPDNEADFDKFKDADYLKQHAKIVFAKTRKPIRSTMIREAIANNTTLPNGESPFDQIPKRTRDIVRFHHKALRHEAFKEASA